MLRHAFVIFFCILVVWLHHGCVSSVSRLFSASGRLFIWYFFISAMLGDCAVDISDQTRRCYNYQRPVAVGAVEACCQAVAIRCERNNNTCVIKQLKINLQVKSDSLIYRKLTKSAKISKYLIWLLASPLALRPLAMYEYIKLNEIYL